MNTTTGKEQRFETITGNQKFLAMLTLEGRRKDDTAATREAENTLAAYGWTPAMIRTWRNRNVPVWQRSKA